MSKPFGATKPLAAEHRIIPPHLLKPTITIIVGARSNADLEVNLLQLTGIETVAGQCVALRLTA